MNNSNNKKSDKFFLKKYGLYKDPFLSRVDSTSFYVNPLILQQLDIFKRFIKGDDFLILILGEQDSGKTTLLNRFIDEYKGSWYKCRINIKDIIRDIECPQMKNLNEKQAYMLKSDQGQIMIIDDAHELNTYELRLLFRFLLNPNNNTKINQIVLLAKPDIKTKVNLLFNRFPEKFSISKIYMPALTINDTLPYLKQKLHTAGFVGENPFAYKQIRAITRTSKGLPGRINKEALKLMCKLPTKKAGYQIFEPAPLINIQLSHLIKGSVLALLIIAFLVLKSTDLSFLQPRDGYVKNAKAYMEEEFKKKYYTPRNNLSSSLIDQTVIIREGERAK